MHISKSSVNVNHKNIFYDIANYILYCASTREIFTYHVKCNLLILFCSLILSTERHKFHQYLTISQNKRVYTEKCFWIILYLFQYARPKSMHNKTAHVLVPTENKNLMLRKARTKRMPFIIAERPSVLK